jgi:hypothetical protein
MGDFFKEEKKESGRETNFSRKTQNCQPPTVYASDPSFVRMTTQSCYNSSWPDLTCSYLRQSEWLYYDNSSTM